MTKRINVNSTTYYLAPLTFGEARTIFAPDADVFEANCSMIAACLNRGAKEEFTADTAGYASIAPQGSVAPASSPAGPADTPVQAGGTWTAELVKRLPFPEAQALLTACLELNGLKPTRENAPRE